MTGMPVFFDSSTRWPLTCSCSSSPLGCISRKKLPRPKMSSNSRAAFSAASGPRRIMSCATSPPRHADRPIRPSAVLAQQLLVDARVVVEALEVPHRVQVREVLPADVVLREQDQVIAAAFGLVVSIGRDIGLAAEDRLHAVLLGLLVEVQRAEQVAVVGDGDLLHAALEHLGKQVVEADRAVEQAVLRVQMQVREFGHARSSSLAFRSARTERYFLHSLSTGGLRPRFRRYDAAPCRMPSRMRVRCCSIARIARDFSHDWGGAEPGGHGVFGAGGSGGRAVWRRSGRRQSRSWTSARPITTRRWRSTRSASHRRGTSPGSSGGAPPTPRRPNGRSTSSIS